MRGFELRFVARETFEHLVAQRVERRLAQQRPQGLEYPTFPIDERSVAIETHDAELAHVSPSGSRVHVSPPRARTAERCLPAACARCRRRSKAPRRHAG